MKLSSRLPRTPSTLSASLDHRLNKYAIAAGAACVGVLAFSSPAAAKIIYTPAHVQITGPATLLDLNHDGIVDFYLFLYGGPSSEFLSVCQYMGPRSLCSRRGTNAIIKVTSRGGSYAAALKYGARIQSRGQFRKAQGELAAVFIDGNILQWFGPWANGGKGVKHGYLGLKFKIKGQFHFGWARLTVLTDTGGGFDATLTGYAYETIPNKAIIAGKTKGQDVMTRPAGSGVGSLGHLALGRK